MAPTTPRAASVTGSPSAKRSTDAAEAEANRISTARRKRLRLQKEDQIFLRLTQFEGFDSLAVERPSREALVGMAEILLEDGSGLYRSEDGVLRAVAGILQATNLLLGMHKDDKSEKTDAAPQVHERSGFWVLVRDELSKNELHDDTNHEHIRLVVSFYVKGFQTMVNSGGIVNLQDDGKSSLVLALIRYNILMTSETYFIRATRNSICKLEEPQNIQTDHAPRMSTPTYAGTGRTSLDASRTRKNVTQHSSPEHGPKYAGNVVALTRSLEDLWKYALTQERRTQRLSLHVTEKILNILPITSNKLRSSFKDFAWRMRDIKGTPNWDLAPLAKSLGNRIKSTDEGET
ncbi:hypothetical protein MN608_09138 [Microdochium nivale]|nr:hypothetical protein MN608_09138 [Microdochium nivale]